MFVERGVVCMVGAVVWWAWWFVVGWTVGSCGEGVVVVGSVDSCEERRAVV